MDWLSSVRSLIPVTRSLAYLDNAGAGPLPIPTVEAVRSYVERWMTRGEPWEDGLKSLVEAKSLFAGMIGAREDEVAAAPGLTYGLNALLSSIPLRGGAAVLGPYNFPTSHHTVHALRSRGLVGEVRVPRGDGACADWESMERAIRDDTELVVVDHVYWETGCVEDIRAVAERAHEVGAVVVTDAFHSVGVIPVDVRRLGVDALLAGSYKWLMGPHGVAFVYVSRELRGRLEPMLGGWMSIEDGVLDRMARGEPVFQRPLDVSCYTPKGDARVLEWGTLPLAVVAGVRESLRLLMEYDAPGRHSTHTLGLVRRLREGLEELGFDVLTPEGREAGIVVFRHGDPYSLAQRLLMEGVVVSPRTGRVRVSPHFYNTRDDVDRLLGVLGLRR